MISSRSPAMAKALFGSIAISTMCEGAVLAPRISSSAFAALHHQRSRGAAAAAFTKGRCRHFHQSTVLNLNRFLFDPSEIDADSVSTGDSNISPTVTLPKDDYRTIHAAKILSLNNGDSLRAGIVVEAGDKQQQDVDGEYSSSYAGLVTDDASIEWLPEGKMKKACPTKNGDPPGSLRISLESLVSFDLMSESTGSSSDLSSDDDSTTSAASSQQQQQQQKQSVSLILALPRPLQLGRMLPMISQMGVDHLVLVAAKKVPKDYFGSHLFRRPEELRRLLIEGLCQCGEVCIPRVTVAKRLKPFLEDDVDELFPPDEVARVIAHPQRAGQDPPLRMRDISFPANSKANPSVVIAVGPEGGWDEPYELDMFERLGFQQITMGTRVLRSDVAVVSLLSLAHDVCNDRRTEVNES